MKQKKVDSKASEYFVRYDTPIGDIKTIQMVSSKKKENDENIKRFGSY